jgi:putative ABC transport system permease protein
MDEEMRFHIEMEAERLVRQQGCDPLEARRRASVAFGGLEKYKGAGRDVRGFQWIDSISLDARLGVRMMVKHRGLTLAGGFAMAVAIAIGAMSFEIFSEVLDPALPVEDGQRVVALRYATDTPGGAERRVLRDFAAWRTELTTIEQLGAFRTVQHNLVTAHSLPEPVRVAEINASGFTVARTPPLLGRYLLPADEQQNAAPVVVLGHRAWQSRFGGDPRIVGQVITLGGTPSTIVGVMPDGFEFPLDHQFWVPFREDPLKYGPLQGPEISMFGRLAPGASMESAQAELTASGARAAADYPQTHARLRPVVLPFTYEPLGVTDPVRAWALRLAQLFVGALVFVVSVNLAILVYARTVTRLGEIAMRTALGASRRRILGQLFVESFVLAVAGAGAGLLLTRVALTQMQSLIVANGSVPFWINVELSTGTYVYAIGLAGLAAFVMGVLPGLKATSGGFNASLRQLHGQGGSRLGPVWTTLVVAQVAVAVAILPMAAYFAWQVVRMDTEGPGFAADQFVVATVAMNGDGAGVDSGTLLRRQRELMSRLEAEPNVSAVTFSSGVPGFAPGGRIELEDSAADADALEISTQHVALDMLAAYDAAIVAGRAFTAADLGADSVVVNRTFARKFIGSRSPLGMRFRYAARRLEAGVDARRSYQIVGVVRDFPGFSPAPGSQGEPTVYHPAVPGDVHPFLLAVRFNGGIPAGFTDRLRTIGAEVDPSLQLRRVLPLSELYGQLRSFWHYLAWGAGLVTLSVLLLSAAGMYALMSFTVARRTREIAIRTALGASPRAIVFTLVSRVARQLAIGFAVGALVAAGVFVAIDVRIGEVAPLVLVVTSVMAAIGLVAAVGPARQGLRVQASDTLKADA